MYSSYVLYYINHLIIFLKSDLQAERRIFTNFHRQVFCWTDHWYGLTMQDIRALEDRTKEELDQVSSHSLSFILVNDVHVYYYL